jgi:hypothetical protein
MIYKQANFQVFFLLFWLFFCFFAENDSLHLLSDFPGIKNLSGLNELYSIISSKKLAELGVVINPDTKMTYPCLLIWDRSSKSHYFIDFWQLKSTVMRKVSKQSNTVFRFCSKINTTYQGLL